ncbi:MAG: site-specific integrase [Acidimicrobiia bacterium]|nr:site-specific integrase [Acidimicrobiia bacterium]
MAVPSEDRAFEVQLALAGFLAGYSGNMRLAYQQDLRQFASWCHNQELTLLAVRRIDIGLFARWLEHKGAAPATIERRLSTVTGFYRYYVDAELLTRNPAANVRRLRLRAIAHETRTERALGL